jgi:hypothetical protein
MALPLKAPATYVMLRIPGGEEPHRAGRQPATLSPAQQAALRLEGPVEEKLMDPWGGEGKVGRNTGRELSMKGASMHSLHGCVCLTSSARTTRGHRHTMPAVPAHMHVQDRLLHACIHPFPYGVPKPAHTWCGVMLMAHM